MPKKGENDFWLTEKFTEAYNREHSTDFAVEMENESGRPNRK